jgi:hypothetical protein
VTISALSLAEGCLVEVGTNFGAPLRGQILIADEITKGWIGLDEAALEMLSLTVGDSIWLRAIEPAGDVP